MGTGAAGLAGAAALSGCSENKTPDQPPSGTDASVPLGGEGNVPEWLGAEPQVAEEDIAETVECDVLVVGDGTAGAFAAGAAAEAGANVLVIDKGKASFGIRTELGAIDSSSQLSNNILIDKHEMIFDLARYADWEMDMRLAYTWADKSGEAIDWYGKVLADAGYSIASNPYAGNPEMRLKAWPVPHSATAESADAPTTDAVVHGYVENAGGAYRYGTSLVKLMREDGRITGAIASDEDGSLVKINAAGGVIVCTGGYAANLDMLKALQPSTLATAGKAAMPHMTGDGVKACLWAGAKMAESHFSHAFDRAALAPNWVAGEEHLSEGITLHIGSQPFLKVNLDGERFMNESCLYDHTLHAAGLQPGNCLAMLYDANWQEQVHQFDTLGCSRAYDYPNGMPPTRGLAYFLDQIDQATEAGYIQQADTIRGLAEKLNIPADTLETTVRRYNELCANGRDEDFGKESFRLMPLDTPPFYGVRMAGVLMATMDGICTDAEARALDENCEVIPGLYVAGNDSNSFFGHSYPNLASGINAGRCATFGRIAGKNAAAEAHAQGA